MPEARFWQLMTHVDRPLLLSGQDDESLTPLRVALSQLPADDIVAFALCLADRLAALLTASRARTGPFGDDALLYAACHAVARGQAWFESLAALAGDVRRPGRRSRHELVRVAAIRGARSLEPGQRRRRFPGLDAGGRPGAVFRQAARVHRQRRRAPPATSPTAYTVYASFEQHPGIARHVEPEENVRVTLAGLLDDYFWCLLDLDDYLGIVNEQGQSFQILHDASKNLYWAEVPCEPTRPPTARNSRAKPCWTCCTACPRTSTGRCSRPQKLAWDE